MHIDNQDLPVIVMRGRPAIARSPYTACVMEGYEDLARLYQTDRSRMFYGQWRTKLPNGGYSEWGPKNGATLKTDIEAKAHIALVGLHGTYGAGVLVTRPYHGRHFMVERQIKSLAAPLIDKYREKIANEPIKAKQKTAKLKLLRLNELVKEWGEFSIDQFLDGKSMEPLLMRWIKERYRVTNLRNRKEKKIAGSSTVRDLDCALGNIYVVAAELGFVTPGESHKRPKGIARIKEEWGTKPTPRGFINEAIAKAIVEVLKREDWAPQTWRTGMILAARAYYALIGSAGIRPGLELLRVRPVDVIPEKHGIQINIGDEQGKHAKGYQAFVWEEDCPFPARKWVSAYIKYRVEVEGAAVTDTLWALHHGQTFGRVFKEILRLAGTTHDPKNNQPLVPYSLRHYHITRLIEQTNWNIERIGMICGTSEDVIRETYDHAIAARWFAGVAKKSRILGLSDDRMEVRTPVRRRR